MIITPNEAAFLTMISHSEGTDRAADPYRVCFGFKHTIISLSDHPSVDTDTHKAEWGGESLAFLGDQYAHSISTAAGRYQLTRPTWSALKAQLDLHDFTGPSQDAAALQLIREKGALALIDAGDVQSAVQRCSSVWASLPYSEAGQPTKSLPALIQAYVMAGGTLLHA